MREPLAMPDPMAKWTPIPDWTKAEITHEGWRARPVLGLTLTLIGGKLDAAIAALATGAPSIGLWRIEANLPAFVRIGRDKALLASRGERVAETGWRDGGWTASDASDAWAVFEIEGASIYEIVREAVAADLEAESASAAVLFAGVPALLHRVGETVARLYVEAALGPHVWRWLETRRG